MRDPKALVKIKQAGGGYAVTVYCLKNRERVFSSHTNHKTLGDVAAGLKQTFKVAEGLRQMGVL